MSTGSDPQALTGLTREEAARRLAAEGPNELPASGVRSFGAIVVEVLKEPMFLLLVACGSLYFFLGDVREGLLLLGFVFIVMGITVYQERKTERALEALRDLSSPRALVLRDGERTRIAGREVVRGDLVIVSEGDRVPADGTVIQSLNLSVDESLLTGESVPVRKQPGDRVAPMSRPGGDDLSDVFSGTLVVQGQGIAEVRATGPAAEMGRIGAALESIETGATLLQKNTAVLVRRIALVGVLFCAFIVVVYGLTRGDWLKGILAGITLAMSILPEELPVILTVFLALGAWRISKKRVLTRRVPAVETLGAATVLCVDKTGTLTLNRMSVASLCVGDRFYGVEETEGAALPEECRALMETAVLASRKDPFDPMEKAIHRIGESRLAPAGRLHEDWTLVKEYPLSSGLLALSHAWRTGEGAACVVASKGAPEAVARLCRMTPAESDALDARVAQMAGEGLRVLGVARANIEECRLPETQREIAYDFVGLVGLRDPVRSTAPAAVAECRAAGIRVVMITGDYPGTAMRIARDIGLENPDTAITGAELEAMDDATLAEKVRSVNIFARVVPEQKLKIVNAFKADGEIVAMTGDGVNDAPALKAAHIGVAMGGRGTDVAREASDIVLLDDDFSSIVGAVRMGRRIFENLRKAVGYTFAIHVPIAGMALFPVLFRWPLAFTPVHIVFLELVIDPACSVVFEAEEEEPGIMDLPPRRSGEPLLNRRGMWLSLAQGLAVLGVVLGLYGYGLTRGGGEEEARTLAFSTLLVANLGLILVNRSRTRTVFELLDKPNKALWWVVGGAAVFLALVVMVPFLRGVFHFGELHPLDAVLCVGAGAASVSWFEVWKLARRTRKPGDIPSS